MGQNRYKRPLGQLVRSRRLSRRVRPFFRWAAMRRLETFARTYSIASSMPDLVMSVLRADQWRLYDMGFVVSDYLQTAPATRP